MRTKTILWPLRMSFLLLLTWISMTQRAGNLKKTAVIDKAALELYEKDPAEAVAFLTDFCVSNANSNIKAWWELGNSLLVKYNHFRIYNSDKRSVGRVETPDWWNEAVVEHDKLEPLLKTKPKPKSKAKK